MWLDSVFFDLLTMADSICIGEMDRIVELTCYRYIFTCDINKWYDIKNYLLDHFKGIVKRKLLFKSYALDGDVFGHLL